MLTTVTSPSASNMMPYKEHRFLTLRSLSSVQGIALYQRWERLCKAAHGAKLKHWFMRECLAEQILPKCLQYLANNNSTNHPFPAHWQAVMQDHIAHLRREKEEKFRLANASWLNLLQIQNPSILLSCKTLAKRTIDHYKRVRLSKLTAKLQHLIDDSPWNNASLTDCVLNLSTHSSSKYELKLPFSHQLTTS